MGQRSGFQVPTTVVIGVSALASAGGAGWALFLFEIGAGRPVFSFVVLVVGIAAGLLALLIVKLPTDNRYAADHRGRHAGGRTVGELADTSWGAISHPGWSDSAQLQSPPPPSAPQPHPLSNPATSQPGPTTRLPRGPQPTAPPPPPTPPPPRNPPLALVPVEPDPTAGVFSWGRSVQPPSASSSPSSSARPQPPPELADYVDSVRVVQCPHCGDFRVDVRRDDTGYAFTCRFDDRHHWQWRPGGPWPTVTARASRHPSDRAR